MSAINAEEFRQICDGVWRDRDDILAGRGILRGEAALVRAVYWRLCKAGGEPGKSIENCDIEHMLLIYQRLVGNMLTQYAHPQFDGAPFLKGLVQQYMYETGQS